MEIIEELNLLRLGNAKWTRKQGCQLHEHEVGGDDGPASRQGRSNQPRCLSGEGLPAISDGSPARRVGKHD
jgi:hypothetical protein